MTKEEILNDCHRESSKFLAAISTCHFPIAYKDAALKAMQEYANKMALDFAEFLEEQTNIIREEKITLYRYRDSNNEYGNYTLEDIFIEFKEKYEG